MATISIRNANTGTIAPATGPLGVVTAIEHGDDILVNGQTATLMNMGGNWFLNGQSVASWFMPTTGPTVAPTDVPPSSGPILSPVPIIRTEPFPVTAAGSLDLTPGTLVILAAAAYFILRGRRS